MTGDVLPVPAMACRQYRVRLVCAQEGARTGVVLRECAAAICDFRSARPAIEESTCRRPSPTHLISRRSPSPARGSSVCATPSRPDSIRIVMVGELDVATAGRARDAIRRAQDDAAEVICDLGDLSFIDVCGLHVLLDASAHARLHGCAADPRPQSCVRLHGRSERLGLDRALELDSRSPVASAPRACRLLLPRARPARGRAARRIASPALTDHATALRALRRRQPGAQHRLRAGP